MSMGGFIFLILIVIVGVVPHLIPEERWWLGMECPMVDRERENRRATEVCTRTIDFIKKDLANIYNYFLFFRSTRQPRDLEPVIYEMRKFINRYGREEEK